LKDGVLCSAPSCNVLSFSDGDLVFNVSSWSNYSAIFSNITLFDIANSSSSARTIYYNFSNSDIGVTNCSLYLSGNYNQSNSSIVNSSANNSFSLAGLDVGNYNAYISCVDSLGNVGNSSMISFAVSEEVAEESGSSGSGGVSSYSASPSNLNEGFKKIIKAGDYLKFNVSNETHSLTLDKINKSYVNVTIKSSPQKFQIKLNEFVLVDVNSDGVYDINVSYNKYLNYYAEIGLKSVSIKAGNNSVVGVSGSDEVSVETEKSFDWRVVYQIGLVLVVLVLVFIIVRRIVGH
jgi:hypothetical protein